jgi:twitching motility protein PilT
MSHVANHVVIDLLQVAQERGASDLHLVSDQPPFVRVHGAIVPLPRAPLSENEIADGLHAILSEEQRRVWNETRQLCFTYANPVLGYFRVNVYSHLGRMETAIRLCARDLPEPEALGIPSIMTDLVRKPAGLLLITGPTGSGKTTTMNALLKRICREARRKVITIEDPVEYVHPPSQALMVQQELGLDVPSFDSAVRHALRQDPDILCIGEMRDLDTTFNALIAAETGHLVIATLHTHGAIGTISRIIDMFPGSQQNQIRVSLTMTLLGVMSQRLLPRADGKGRLLVYELLVSNDAVRNLIRENKIHQIQSQLQTGRAQGMREMDTMVREAYMAGDITYETATNVISNPRLLSLGG